MKTSQRTSLLRYVLFIASLCCGQPAFAQAQPPTITSAAPMTGTPKQNVAINGANFSGSGITSRTIRLNGVNVGGSTLVASAGNKLIFTVPGNATSGPITVTTVNGSTTIGTATAPGGNFIVASGPPPANDNFANAQVLTGASGAFIGSTANATKELGEPNHAGDAGGASVWFSWTAPTSGLFLFNPHDSAVTTTFGVNLALYTGTTLGNLSPIGSGVSGNAFSRYTAAVILNATAGVTYLIAIDGFTGIMGDYKLAWSPLAPPTIASLSPTSGYVGQSFAITGDGFTPGTQVTVGGATVSQARVTVNNPTSITVAQIPGTAALGSSPVTVTTPAGSASSATTFNVVPPPAPIITSLSTSNASAGTTVTITGTALWLGDGTFPTVTFNGGAVTNNLTLTSSTSIAARVPSGAVSGPITVQTTAGTGTSSASLNITSAYLAPVISSFSPTTAGPGDTVTIVGQNLYGSSVFLSFNGAAASFTVEPHGTVMTAIVPSGAMSGPLFVSNPAGSAVSSTSFTMGLTLPSIGSFTPGTFTNGTSVIISGSNLSAATNVSFNGVAAASFTVNSDTAITAIVPSTVPLLDGPISVTTPSGTATSGMSFTYLPPPPTISDFYPTFFTNGNTVFITGTNFYNVQSVAFNGTPAASFSVESSTQIAAVVPAGSLTDGPVSVTTTGGSAFSSTSFTYAAQPVIASFSPSTISSGQPVVITGSGFTYVAAVGFNGVPAASFVVDSSTQITAIVPAGPLTNGPITVTTMVGAATSATSFNYIVSSPVPTITSFSPAAIGPGLSVTINGSNFVAVNSVRFNGVSATSFTVSSPNQIFANAPTGVTAGAITVTTANGTATSPSNYTVTLAPIITGITTSSGPEKRIVTVSGANFSGTGISGITPRFNGLSVGSFSVGSTTLTFAVPVGATTGPITIQTNQGLATSPFNFTVINSGTPPANDNFINAQPISGPAGSFNGNNVYATKEAGEPNHANNPGGASVWFSWTAPQSGLFLFSPNPVGSQFGITQAIYTGSSVSTLTQVASGLTPTNIFARYGSAAVLNAVAGTTYYIALDGFNGVMADFRLTWSPLSAPVISSFSPSSATAGQTININISGLNFTPGAPVSFGNVIVDATKITYQSQGLITVTQIPITAVTGPITVVTPAGTATSAANFTVTPPPAPTITSFSPDNGIAGSPVTITGTNFTGASAVLFNGVASSFTVATSSTITATVPTGASSGPITVVAPGGSATSATSFTIPLPTISDFLPATITDGTSVTINGTNFTNVLAVAFNGVSASLFSVVSSTQLTANAPVGPLANGPITVTTTAGTATSAASFTYVSPPPTITSFSPTALAPGLSVTLTGTGFSGVSSVRFNGVSASFTVSSNNQITATAPSGLSAGAIVVTTPQGTATSATNYTITLTPIITGVSTTSGPVGRIITVNGSNFSGTGISGLNVRVNGVQIGSFSSSNSTLTFAVPAGATTGPITVQTNQGLATSPFTFTVLSSGTPPANDSFANAQLISGTSGTFNGNNVFATKEPGEPNHANNPGGASVWFSWTAPQSGLFLFNPFNSSSSQFGIMQSIYTGSSVSSLTLVASGVTPTNVFVRYNAAAVLNAVAGTTYYIALDGFNGVMADYRLTWSPLSTPAISSFSPSSATAGQTININIFGSNFTPGAPVSFGGGLVDSTKVTYQSQTLITVTQVPITAVTGPITVVTPAGTATSAATFNVTPPPAPTIAGFVPDVGAIGTTITVNGTNFAGTSAVRFNGTAAASFTVAANGQSITTTVPVGASSGLVTVVAPGGTATSATPFTVASPPVIGQQPQSQTVTFGQSATFLVGASSVLPLTFDWRKNGVSIGSANPTASTAALTISSATMSDAAAYDCVVTNSLGSVASTAATLTVNPAPATVTLASLTATYDGSPKSVTATTNPAGLGVQITYGGSLTPPANAGTYAISAQIADSNYSGSTTGTLTISKASATLVLNSVTVTYDGHPHAATATTIPAGLGVNLVYNLVNPTPPTNAGTYVVLANIVDNNYSGFAIGSLSITPATATIGITNLAQTYDGTPKSANVTVSPTSVGLNITYNGSNAAPTNAGSYAVAVSVVDDNNNYTGSASATLVIGKAAASVTLGGVSATYDTTPHAATATTTPAGLNVSFTYDGSATAPTNAGSYTVAATINDNNYTGSASGTLSIGKAAATVSLGSLAQTYDGSPKSVSITTAPAGLATTLTYDGNATAPTNAGSYAVAANVTDPNYTGSANGALTIAKGTATISLGGLAQTYDGAPKSVTAATSPAGLGVALTYDGAAAAPTNAGSYAVAATITSANYSGSANGVLVIAKGAATVALANLVQPYNGQPRVVSTSTSPTGLNVNVTYDGNTDAPSNPGSYAVVATIADADRAGSASGTLVVTISALVRHAPSLSGGLDGSLQVLLGEDTTLNGNAYISGDLLVPGMPTLTLSGHPTVAGTRDGTGAATPTNYQVSLNGNALLRYLVRRTDAIALPTVATPPAPTSPHDVTLTGNAGAVAVPAGTYGSLSASGNSSLILGDPNSSTPAVYNVQTLALAGNGQLQIAGPVVINLANGTSLSGGAGNSAHPEWLVLNVASGGVTLNNATVYGSIAAPNGTVTINANSTLHGSVACDRLVIAGNGLLDGR